MMINHLILGYAIFRYPDYSDSRMWKWIRLPMKYQGNIQQYQVFCCDQGMSAVWGKTSTGTAVFISFPSQRLWHSSDIKTCQDMSEMLKIPSDSIQDIPTAQTRPTRHPNSSCK